LWCIALSAMYKNNLVYFVRGSFLDRFGRIPTYWFAIICAFIAAIFYDIAIITLRVTFFPKDADVFAELEKDPLIKARFEEEAAAELQQGWNRGKGNKEDEIQALLSQPRRLEEGNASVKSWSISTKIRTSDENDETAGSDRDGDISGPDEPEGRQSFTHTKFDEEIAQRFGAVIQKPFKRLPMSESS
jgi:phospholipid-translocating ATPase